jgi:hypothetical protein
MLPVAGDATNKNKNYLLYSLTTTSREVVFFNVYCYCMSGMNDLPSPWQCYKDDRGTLVTIVSVEEKRVVFMREGYPYPCMRPIYNFLAKFKKISENGMPIQ